jgi:hypothetical protein
LPPTSARSPAIAASTKRPLRRLLVLPALRTVAT